MRNLHSIVVYSIFMQIPYFYYWFIASLFIVYTNFDLKMVLKLYTYYNVCVSCSSIDRLMNKALTRIVNWTLDIVWCIWVYQSILIRYYGFVKLTGIKYVYNTRHFVQFLSLIVYKDYVHKLRNANGRNFNRKMYGGRKCAL